MYIGFKFLRELQAQNKNASSEKGLGTGTGSFLNLPSIAISGASGGGAGSTGGMEGHGSISSATSSCGGITLTVPDKNGKPRSGLSQQGLQIEEVTADLK